MGTETKKGWSCNEYGKGFGKLIACVTCPYGKFCKDSTAVEKQHVDYTTRDRHAEIDAIAALEKSSNISGKLIAELLKITDFNLVRFFVVICRLGNLTYKEIGANLGISDVQVFNYCESLPPRVKRYLKNKSLTMLEIEEAFREIGKIPGRTEGKDFFGRTSKRKIFQEFGR